MRHPRRARLAALLIGGSFLPTAAAVVVFGCCHLPLHGLVHRSLPMCELASEALAHHHEDSRPATPAPSRPESRPAVEAAWRPIERLAAAPSLVATLGMSLLSPGQPLRQSLPASVFHCDDDVGVRLAFLDTLRL